ncbi:multiheme c-type cytochrome [Tuwongella immobilis]|uniref:Cytochrome c-552/4 domain-containing protein n=1 Tax=Tuwongella immobilis TaxID=692036 RepID=A0A6C2YLC4_9BACT|nr:multiheme c-type cytochrome [Tuwongella immobilis]VIP02378.1 Probable cytochrome c-554 OS=Planctomyces maris DSM 8797 GN=PM8797T_17674 PE=4 SV=1: Cytochrome_C554 [Tuwongella immobilis]VTS01220.1 Probable cytochrome c-554 OS=Planctomyces maris DSM 8797 GN=PM8797T_17674 PE=4 SV=1: Cytochrome_C554 [Tuwongella immobilis]
MQRPDQERSTTTRLPQTRLNRRWTVRLLGVLGVACLLTLAGVAMRSTVSVHADEEGPPLPGTGPSFPIPTNSGAAPVAPAALSGESPYAKSVDANAGPTALAKLFSTWPQDQQPELVLVLSGQMYGYLQPCGCSRPQLGGLERRYNLIDLLKRERKWNVLPLDLGDLANKKGLHKQNLLKHRVTMEALDAMGYQAVGVGIQDFRLPLLDALAGFTLQKGDVPPFVLGGNIAKRSVNYPGVGSKPMVGLAEVIAKKNQPTVGVVGVIGSQTAETVVREVDPKVEFESNGVILRDALKQIDAANPAPEVRVLLYQGGSKEAKLAAEAFTDFNVVLCKTEEEEPPTFPTMIGKDGEPKRMLIGVGHKGRHVGVVGIFRNQGKIDLRYQLVSLGEDYETPDDRVEAHPVLKSLEAYTAELKRDQYLRMYPKVKHPVQVSNPGARFVGSQACQSCHVNEYAIWADSKHAKAYEALSTIATKPANRNFDGECIICHTVGFAFEGGFVDMTTTPQLKGVGCENCHGPGSLHVAEPRNQAFYAALSPWKVNPKDRLPEVARMMHASANLTTDEKRTLGRVDETCQKCHDTDNDPHFRLEDAKYWPSIVHGNGNRPLKKK